MIPKAPDIPRPRLDDEDYMKVWHKYLQANIERIHMENQRDTWRMAFYAVAIISLLIFALLVLCGSKLTSSILLSLGHLQASLDDSHLRAAFFTLHSSLFT